MSRHQSDTFNEERSQEAEDKLDDLPSKLAEIGDDENAESIENEKHRSRRSPHSRRNKSYSQGRSRSSRNISSRATNDSRYSEDRKSSRPSHSRSSSERISSPSSPHGDRRRHSKGSSRRSYRRSSSERSPKSASDKRRSPRPHRSSSRSARTKTADSMPPIASMHAVKVGEEAPGVEDFDSKSNRTMTTLYGSGADAHAKAKAAIGGGFATSPGATHVDSNSTISISTLYGTDAAAKAKVKASAPPSSPGAQRIFSSPDNSKRSVTTNALYGSDADAKAKTKALNGSPKPRQYPGLNQIFSPSSSPIWQKDKAPTQSPQSSTGIPTKATRGGAPATNPVANSVISSFDSSTNSGTQNNTTTGTLYGHDADADAKIKAKASRESTEPASSPGVETVYFNNSTHSAISTLYGSEADSKADARTSRLYSKFSSSPGAESVADTRSSSRTVDTLYGNDTDAKAKARGGATAFAAYPGVERVASRMPITEEDESVGSASTDEEKSPVARRVSIISTDSESVSNPVADRKTGPSRKTTPSEAMEGFRMPNDPEAVSKRRRSSNGKEAVVEEEPGKSRRKRMAIFLLLLLLIGGGAAVWYFLFRSDGGKEESEIQISNVPDVPTNSPSLAIATSASPMAPTVVGNTSEFPSTAPSDYFIHKPPSELECKAIAANETIPGRETMLNSDFYLGVEVVLSENNTMTKPLLDDLLYAIQEKILPSLVGCSIDIYEELEAWRYAIFDAFVTGSLSPDEFCSDEALAIQNCHRVSVKLDLFLKGFLKVVSILGLISDEKENIANHLGLSDPFSTVKLIEVNSALPSPAPSGMPSDSPSVSPTEFPTAQWSSNPSDQPSMVPTRAPTGEPSLSRIPSAGPSMVPTTALPSISPSISPSALFSGTPTLAPTTEASASPTRIPTTSPSNNPTPAPSKQPTPLPTTPGPTLPPTVSPAPSRNPTSMPTSTPTANPSLSPTIFPSSEPTITSFHWVACGRFGLCTGSATLQNSNDDRIGGTGSDIAVRCCSDTLLSGFNKPTNDASCPFSESPLAGVCYNRVTYHEANDLCTGLGARLCTQSELDGDCARGSGCGHDWRFVWSSDPGP